MAGDCLPPSSACAVPAGVQRKPAFSPSSCLCPIPHTQPLWDGSKLTLHEWEAMWGDEVDPFHSVERMKEPEWKSGAPIVCGTRQNKLGFVCALAAEHPSADWCKFNFSPRVAPFGGTALREVPIWFNSGYSFWFATLGPGEVRPSWKGISRSRNGIQGTNSTWKDRSQNSSQYLLAMLRFC